MIEMYCENLPIPKISRLSKSYIGKSISKVSLYRYFRMFNILIYYEMKRIKDSLELDGEIEIDETVLYKLRKGRRGRLAKTKVWVFGMVERHTGRCIFYSLKKRRRWKILFLIFKHVKQGSRIFTDCFSTYVNNLVFPKISYLEMIGFDHFPIDHSISKLF